MATWAGVLGASVVLGLPATLAAGRTVTWLSVRVAMWSGLLVAVVLILAVNLLVPLRSAAAAGVMAGAVVAAVIGVIAIRPRWAVAGPRNAEQGRSPRWTLVALIAALGAGTGYFAVAALGPVTNYDSGLYHLGAIAYAGDYSTIPGLANLYQALGYNNSQFPFSAFLGNGPWDGVGYRLANGLFLMAMATDLLVRLLGERRRPGTYVLLVAVVATWVPLLALSDYWVTSPTSDSAVMVFSLVSIAYLADALRSRASFPLDAGAAFVTAILAFSMRPTMILFLAAVTAVLVLRAWTIRRRRPGPAVRAGYLAVLASLGMLLVAVQTVRDYLLSGWLQYPLSFVRFDVPWLAIDPTASRASTLGVARDPSNYLEASQGWSWVAGWFARLVYQWELFEFAALVVFAVGVGLVARRTTGTPVLSRSLALLLLPGALAVVFWWVASPPSFRFIWGPLFGLAVAPAGWFCFLLAERGRWPRASLVMPALAAGSATVLLVIVGYCGVLRLDTGSASAQRTFELGPLEIEYAITPIPVPPTREVAASADLTLLMPVASDQCWGAYPLCTPLMESAVSLRGRSIQDGFNP